MPDEMTPRERWLAVLNRQPFDRFPLDYRATPEMSATLVEHMGAADMAEVRERLHIDPVMGVGGRYVGPAVAPDEDVFGVKYEMADYGTGVYREVVSGPLEEFDSIEEIEANYTWPSPDWWDYSEIPSQIEGKEDRPMRGGGSEPFLTYKSLRGQEQAFMDLVLHPEMVHYCLDKLFALAYEGTSRIYEQVPGKVMITYVAEDLGSQSSLLISREHIHEFLLPRMKRMMDLAHEAGAYVFHHSDGSIMDILPDMIETGIDVLNPIQWRCEGMDREVLKARFGGRIAFHGAMDNQQTLPFGSVEDVRIEVADNIRMLGEGGGYILAPCHNIQAVSPPENIVAMYETAYELGWY